MTSSAPNYAAQGASNAYLRTKVLSARPEELRLLLLDGAIRFAMQGREGLATKNYEMSYNGITQCRNIIVELLTTIKTEPDPELAANVRAIYAFLYQETIEASLNKDATRMDKVIELLQYDRETWAQLIAQVAAETNANATAKAATLSVHG
jgi:flagellar secretion chaperone FliS